MPDFKDPDVSLLRELLNRRPVGRDPLDAIQRPDLPSVPHPSGFRPDPLINGTPRLGRAVNELHKIAPELRGRVGLVSTAPTPGLLEEMNKADIHPINSNYMDTVGMHSPAQPGVKTPEVWLRNDNFYHPDAGQPKSLEQTLAHELGHSVGQHHPGGISNGPHDMINLLAARILGR